MNRFTVPRAMRRRPTVSVVVPCYNYGHYLPDLLAGLRSQPGVDVDVVIVDDASPDGSGEVAQALAGGAVRVIRHRTNKGHIATYNDGLAAAEGDYVVLLSADDVLPAGALGRAVALMERRPTVGLVYGYVHSFEGDPPPTTGTTRSWSTWSGRQWLGLSVERARSFVVSPEVVMRRSALEQVGPYDPRLPHSADWDLWLRTALTWDIGRVNGPVQALYRVHHANMHLTQFAGFATDIRERRATLRIFFEEHAADRPDVQALRGRAVVALAQESARRSAVARHEGRPEAAAEFDELAVDLWPGVRDTALWRFLHSVQPGSRASGAIALAERGRHHLHWRRQRWFGT